MRVVHLAGYGGPYPGSFIPMLRAIMRAARGRGCEAEAVFTPISRERAWLGELEQDGIAFRFAPEGRSRSDLTRWISDLLAEHDGPTVLHTHFTHFDVAAATAGARRNGAAVVWHIHTPHLGGPAAFTRNYLKYAVFGRRVDQILCVSPDLVDTIVRRGAPRRKVEFIHNAVDTDRFPVLSPERRRAAREQAGFPNGRRVLVHFGWDWPRKGGDLYCRALAQLRESGVAVAGVSVGGGEPARELAAELGLGEDFVVLDPTDDVQAMYAAADVFVAPSRAEGTPFSVLEAVSSGTPAVVSDIPGHATVGGHAPACVITPLEPAAIASATRDLLDRNAAQASADSLAGHEWLRKNLGLGPWTEAMVDRYESLLDGRGHAPARAAA
jgi:glycosyltransferase involved in cell wall biosynthesis